MSGSDEQIQRVVKSPKEVNVIEYKNKSDTNYYLRYIWQLT